MPNSWLADRSRLFPAEVIRLSQAMERKYRVPACLTLAQWACESDYGRRVIGKANPFGIKWRKGCGFPALSIPTHEVIKGKRISVEALFIDFPSLEAAFEYRAKLITNPKGPYRACLKMISDWAAYLAGIAGIYATDPDYAKTLRGIVDSYHLADLNLPKGAA